MPFFLRSLHSFWPTSFGRTVFLFTYFLGRYTTVGSPPAKEEGKEEGEEGDDE
jgi:hypothetical protein